MLNLLNDDAKSAIEQAQKMQQAQQTLAALSGATSQYPLAMLPQPMQAPMGAMQMLPQQQQFTQRPGMSMRNGGKCYNCGGENHLARDCMVGNAGRTSETQQLKNELAQLKQQMMQPQQMQQQQISQPQQQQFPTGANMASAMVPMQGAPMQQVQQPAGGQMPAQMPAQPMAVQQAVQQQQAMQQPPPPPPPSDLAAHIASQVSKELTRKVDEAVKASSEATQAALEEQRSMFTKEIEKVNTRIEDLRDTLMDSLSEELGDITSAKDTMVSQLGDKVKNTVAALKAVKDMQANFDKRQKAFEKEQRQRLTQLQSHDQAEAGLTSTALRDLAREFTTMRREVEKDRVRTATLTKKLDGVTNAVAKEQRRRSSISERREHTATEAAPTSPTVSSRGRVRQPSRGGRGGGGGPWWLGRRGGAAHMGTGDCRGRGRRCRGSRGVGGAACQPC